MARREPRLSLQVKYTLYSGPNSSHVAPDHVLLVIIRNINSKCTDRGLIEHASNLYYLLEHLYIQL